MPENRPCWSPSKEKARYSLHNKTLYDPGCSQAILRGLSYGISLAVSVDRFCKYLLQGETIGCPVSLQLCERTHSGYNYLLLFYLFISQSGHSVKLSQIVKFLFCNFLICDSLKSVIL